MAQTPEASLDWPRIERWTAAIVADDTEELCRVFAEAGARGPALRWRPPVETLDAQQHRFLLRYWDDLRSARPMPNRREIDAVEMRPALGYINLADAIEGGRDFRYRVFGSIIAAVSGFDLTGQYVSAVKASAYIVEFGLAAYRAALRRGEPLLTVHGPPAAVYTATWHRLVLPLADDTGVAARLLVAMVPMAHDGTPVTFRL